MSQKDESPAHDTEKDACSDDSSTIGLAHTGVKKIEAVHKVYGKYTRWIFYLCLGLAAYIYSLDGTTTWNYMAFATSSFGHHSFLSSIQTAQSIIVAVGKPVIAKVADVRSRGTAYMTVLVFYVVGYVVIASAKNAETVAGGIIIYSVGYTGLQMLTQIIIADITTLRWRGITTSLMSLPFIINAFVGSNIAANVLKGAGWRWGYGMFAILVPATIGPLIVVLLWAENKAKRLGYITKTEDDRTFLKKSLDVCEALDVVGLLILGASIALILLPLTLFQGAKGGFKNPSMIAMLVVGIILLPVYAIWEWKFAKYPVIARRFIQNRTVVVASLVGAFDFLSFYISFTYLYSFVLIVKPWDGVKGLLHASYFVQTQTVALTVFAIMAGVIFIFLRRAKIVLIIGLMIRLLGTGLMIHSRGANASDVEIVWSQILQGIGGGFAAVSAQLLAQASVTHADTAMVTAVVLLVTEIGAAIGSAIAGAIWTSQMPKQLAKNLPFLTDAQRTELFGSLYAVAANPHGDPIREAVIVAYDAVMKNLTIAACAFAVVPLAISLIIPNWYLGDVQNAVDNRDLAGNKVEGKGVAPSEKS